MSRAGGFCGLLCVRDGSDAVMRGALLPAVSFSVCFAFPEFMKSSSAERRGRIPDCSALLCPFSAKI